MTDSDGNIRIGSADGEGVSKSKQFEYGFIAQEIETVFSDMGRGYTDFAGMVDQEVEQNMVAGTLEEHQADPDNVWFPGDHCYDPDHSSGIYQKTKGLNYEQFDAPLVKAVQELSAENTALNARVTTLEG